MERDLDPSGFDTDFLSNQIDINEEDILRREAAEREEEERLAKADYEARLAEAQNEITSEDAAGSFNQQAAPQPVNPNAFMAQQDVNQQLKDPSQFGPGENVIELRNAIAKGGLDAIRSGMTAPERLFDAARGEEIGAEGYEPEWNPMKDTPSPFVKTWWGKIAEDITHYGSFGLGLILGTGGAIASAGPLVTGMTAAGLAGLLSDKHDGDNLSGEIVKRVPEMDFVIGAIATKDSDHPLLKKFKTVVEEMGLAGTFDKILGKLFGEDGAVKALARRQNQEEQVIEKGKIELAQSMQEVEVRDISGVNQLDSADPRLEASVEPVEVRDITDVPRLPPEGGIPAPKVRMRGHLNKPIADPWQGAPNSTNTPFDIHQQLNKIDADPSARSGSTDSVMTPAQAERMATESGLTEKFLRQKAKELVGDYRYQQMLKEAKANNKTFKEVFEPAYKRMQEVMGRNATSVDSDDFWKPILDDITFRTGGKESMEAWSMENVIAADLVNASLFKQLRDLSIGARELFNIADIADTDGPMKTITDRLIVGMSNVKRSRYLISSEFRKLQGPRGAKRAADALNKIEEDTRNSIQMAMTLVGKDGNEELLQGLIEAFSMSNKIHNWTDLDKFMRKKLWSLDNNSVILRELSGVMINSILSGVTTPIRAIAGTGIVGYLQPMGRALGSLARLDIDNARANFAAMNAYTNMIPEAFQVFRTQLDSYWSGDIANMRTRFTDTNKFDESWEAFGKWTEIRGSNGDKAAYYIANMARGLNDNKILSWSPRVMAATDDTYRFIMARARAKEKAYRQAFEMKRSGDIMDIRPDDIKKLESKFYNQLLDESGNIDLDKDEFLKASYKEATLTKELSGFSKDLDQVFSKYPLVKPFYLFARTGVNGLNLTFKNSPALGLLHKKNLDIMFADPDNLDSVMKYGIETAADLKNARSEIVGQQIIGNSVVFMGMQKYQNGELTGNGPQDRAVRENWIKAGWQPRSIKIGGAWLSYDLFEPFAMMLSTMADIGDNNDLMGEEWTTDKLQKSALAAAGAATSKSYLAGLSQLVDLLSMQPGTGGKIGANLLNNSLPGAGMRNALGKVITPYYRELGSGIGDSIRNRNLALEQAAGDPLAIKYDILNGKPLRDWQFWQRALNAVFPVNFSIDTMTPGRKLFLESNYDARTSVYSSPDGYSLKDSPKVRSLYMRAIGLQKLEGTLDALAARKDVQASMELMRSDIRNGRQDKDPMKAYKHNDLISSAFLKAQQRAWASIQNDPAVVLLMDEQDQKESENRKTRQSQVQQLPRIIEINNPN